jgi:predicted nucleic acid-binding protein
LIESAGRVLESITALPYDVAIARAFGQIRAALEGTGTPPPDADLQIAATAIYHNLQLVTGNLRHFNRVPGLTCNPILAECRNR